MTRGQFGPTRSACMLTLLVGCCISCLDMQPTAGGHFTIGQNFSDSSISQSGFIPPDTMGAVGTNDIAVLINGRFSVYNRSGVQQSTKSLNQFWIDAGVVPAGSFAFDPRIIYDKHTDRWFATSVDNGGGANNFLVAVSATGDPKGTWTGFAIDSDSDNSHWADFPMLGLNQDVVTISANMFAIGAGSTKTGFLVIPKSDLTQAVPTVANATQFQDVDPNTTGFTPQPIFDYDNGNLAQPILSAFNKPSGFLKTSSIGGTALAPSLNTPGGFIAVTARNSPPDIDQPGPKANIDTSNNRFSGNVVMQQIPGRTNPSIWGVHGVDIAGRAAVEWYEIDSVTNAVLQSGTVSDPSLAFNFPSIAVNDFGDVVLGFSGGDPSTFMSTFAAVGQTIAGVTTFESPVQTKAGVADYQILDPSGRNRWGDYSATVVDPIDEYSFWTFQEFANATDSWRIQVTQITVVPEPSSLALAGMCCLALTTLARRRA
ncbi:MAG: PEP-CTERM sorting domain-containing protein [Planctomycetales bacterium]|nr:PEP-CTERM sorting domain-containing protein [Planctomycetales bacterium]